MQEYAEGDGDLLSGLVLETAGFLVQRSETVISIAMDYNGVSSPTWRHVANIPLAYVLEFYLLGAA